MTVTDAVQPDSTSSAPEKAPRIWLVIGDKPGDNAQVEMIAERLGLPYEIKRVLPRPEFVLGKPRFDISLEHLDLDRSDKLEAPWPDLILTIGRRPSMAALWVQQQSGDQSKIVLLGRPKRWQERFDLIIAPSQYRLPPDRRVLQLELPLMRSQEDKITAGAEAWHDRLGALEHPLTALLVGGETKPFRFDAPAARELLQRARQAAGKGHLFISTSRRTSPQVINALKQNLPDNTTLYCWSADATDNPYFGLLALADQFIVTGDSVSMMVEIARLGRPLAIYPLPYRGQVAWRLQQWVGRKLHGGQGALARVGKWLHKLGLMRYSRDLTEIHQQLYDQRLAVELDQDWIREGRTPADELQLAVDRVKQVLAQ